MSISLAVASHWDPPLHLENDRELQGYPGWNLKRKCCSLYATVCRLPNSVLNPASSLFNTTTCIISRCEPPAECVPNLDPGTPVALPVATTEQLIRIPGVCIEPCSEDCSAMNTQYMCGTDGRTYENSCYRECANVPVSSSGCLINY